MAFGDYVFWGVDNEYIKMYSTSKRFVPVLKTYKVVRLSLNLTHTGVHARPEDGDYGSYIYLEHPAGNPHNIQPGDHFDLIHRPKD